MKNITISLFTILCLMINYSCVKEQDITTSTISTTEPEEGGTDDLTGFVRDTLGQVIPNANVKLYLGDLELETETDVNGEYNFLIPSSVQNGYIVADKSDFSKSIQRLDFTNESDEILKPIYLIKELEDNLDLNINVDDLLIVKGRTLDEFNNPIEGARVLVLTVKGGPEFKIIVLGYVLTDEEGYFEVIYENDDYFSASLTVLLEDPCNRFITQNWFDFVPELDLGNLEYISGEEKLFKTIIQSDGSNCYGSSDDVISNTYLVESLSNHVIDQPLGDISITYCDNYSDLFYVGVESLDKDRFNGGFYDANEIIDPFAFDICTPTSDEFLEVKIDDELILITEGLDFDETGNLIVNNDFENLITFNVNPRSEFSSGNVPLIRYAIANFFTLFEDGEEKYSLDNNSIAHINILEDETDFITGLLNGKVTSTNGDLKDLIIRFRIEK